MDLSFSAADLAFQREVREFIAANYPADIKARFDAGLEPRKDDFVRWQKILYRKGWMAPSWPKQYGGPGWTPMQQHIFDNVPYTQLVNMNAIHAYRTGWEGFNLDLSGYSKRYYTDVKPVG